MLSNNTNTNTGVRLVTVFIFIYSTASTADVAVDFGRSSPEVRECMRFNVPAPNYQSLSALSNITGVLLSTAKRVTTAATYKMLTNVLLSRLNPYADETNAGQKCEPRHMRSNVITYFTIVEYLR
jgi:hypothetical protein